MLKHFLVKYAKKQKVSLLLKKQMHSKAQGIYLKGAAWLSPLQALSFLRGASHLQDWEQGEMVIVTPSTSFAVLRTKPKMEQELQGSE